MESLSLEFQWYEIVISFNLFYKLKSAVFGKIGMNYNFAVDMRKMAS